jgi:hypothetical protein
VRVLEDSLERERTINDDLEKDLKTAVDDGIQYRDNLRRILEIREKEERARAEEREQLAVAEDEAHAAMSAALKEAEKSTAFERAEAQRLSVSIAEVEQERDAAVTATAAKRQECQGLREELRERVEALTAETEAMVLLCTSFC